MLRRDDWVTDAMGNALSGASVYVCSQPATTTTIPPSPLAQLYSDPAGAFPITQPVITDGYGHAFYYAAPGTYTIVYYSPQILETILPDQNIGSGNVTFPITVAQGGTNATTAAQALINLGAAGSGTNADITSLTAIPTTKINSSGYVFGTTYGTSQNGVTIANEAFPGSSYTGPGVGVQSPTGGTIIGAGTVLTTAVQAVNVSASSLTQAGPELRVGSGTVGTPGLIHSSTTGQTLTIGPLGAINTNPQSVTITPGTSTPTNGVGLLAFDTNYFTQTTVGAAGAASALPATPRGYLQFVAPDGTICVFPFYKAS